MDIPVIDTEDNLMATMTSIKITEETLQNFREKQPIWCLCKKTKLYYSAKILTKNINSDNTTTFKVHFAVRMPHFSHLCATIFRTLNKVKIKPFLMKKLWIHFCLSTI